MAGGGGIRGLFGRVRQRVATWQENRQARRQARQEIRELRQQHHEAIKQQEREIRQTVKEVTRETGTTRESAYRREMAQAHLDAVTAPTSAGRSEAQERRDRLFRSQVRMEERGEESALFGGSVRSEHRERVFYMATQSIWAGEAPQDRDAAIMAALGADSLEEAHDMVLAENADALAAMRDISAENGGTFRRKIDSPTAMRWINAVTGSY